MNLAQICGDWLSIARRQTGGIAVLCRGFVNAAGTVKTREDGVSELINTPKFIFADIYPLFWIVCYF